MPSLVIKGPPWSPAQESFPLAAAQIILIDTFNVNVFNASGFTSRVTAQSVGDEFVLYVENVRKHFFEGGLGGDCVFFC